MSGYQEYQDCTERYTGPEVEGWCRALWDEGEKKQKVSAAMRI